MEIIEYPDPFLRREAERVEDFSAELKKAAQTMITDMYSHQGIGLAGTQVGIGHRIFVFDVSQERNEPVVMLNPEIEGRSSDLDNMEEGCLSVPGIREGVSRPDVITVTWQDLEGTEHKGEFEGLAARVIQHELDHLDGKLFVDRINGVRKFFVDRQLKKIEKRDT